MVNWASMWCETYNLVTDYILSHNALYLFQVCLLSPPHPYLQQDPKCLEGQEQSFTCFSVSPAAQSSGTREQALELLYLNSQSTNTHGQGEAVQKPSHFLMSAALAYHRFLRERTGEAGTHGP